MYKLYRIVNKISASSYVGMTRKSLNKRWNEHIHNARKGKKTKFYDAMRSYGFENFEIILISKFDTRQECCEAEIYLIAKEDNLYNLAAGGDGGFVVVNLDQWKQKLKEARKGGKPFLGRNHTEETKKKCRQAALNYWASKRAEINDLG